MIVRMSPFELKIMKFLSKGPPLVQILSDDRTLSHAVAEHRDFYISPIPWNGICLQRLKCLCWSPTVEEI